VEFSYNVTLFVIGCLLTVVVDNCQKVDKSRIRSWLYSCRLPLFLQTDLYAEYLLVQCLLRRSAAQKQNTEITVSSNYNVFAGGGAAGLTVLNYFTPLVVMFALGQQ